jgi:hypothetical protein
VVLDAQSAKGEEKSVQEKQCEQESNHTETGIVTTLNKIPMDLKASNKCVNVIYIHIIKQ